MPETADLQREVADSKAYSALPSASVAHLDENAHGIIAELEQWQPKKGRLLDIGCGPGILLSVARGRGWQPTGLELSTDAVMQCKADGHDVVDLPLSEETFEKESFDAIVLHHVLEHVPDANLMLYLCSSFLKSGGSLFIAVPNASSWRARIQGPINGYVYQRDHLLFFDRMNLKRIVARHIRGPISVETRRLGGRVGARVRRSLAGRFLQAAMEGCGLGVEIRCWAKKP